MAEPSQRPRRHVFDRAWLLMTLPALFWAGNAIVGRAVAGDVPPVGLAFWRWTVGALILLPFAWRHLGRDIPALVRAWPIVAALSALGVAVYNTFLYIAAQTTTALNIVMLQTAMPVLIVAINFILFRERVRLRQALGIAVCLLGALTLITQGDLALLLDFHLNTGDVWMLAAVVSYATYTALLRRRPAVHGLSLVVATFALGALMLLPFYLAETAGGRPLAITGTSMLAIGYVSLFASILSYLSFNRAVAVVGANLAGTAIYLVPVFGTALAILLLGEAPRFFHGAGIALIAAGIGLSSNRLRLGR